MSSSLSRDASICQTIMNFLFSSNVFFYFEWECLHRRFKYQFYLQIYLIVAIKQAGACFLTAVLVYLYNVHVS